MSVRLRARSGEKRAFLFTQGTHAPFAIRWFGATSLFGHARHFAASAIVSESVDARDWMHPDRPPELVDRIVGALGGAPTTGPAVPAAGAAGPSAADRRVPSLVERLGHPLWIDFVADTGDDRDTSSAVAEMIFAEYTVGEDGATRELPRGDILLFGGDTAYPVATAEEIDARVVTPWNEVLARAGRPSRARVLLGIPGNHDWYDGLDGFARFFRRARRDEAPPASAGSVRPPRPSRPSTAKKRAFLVRQLHLDELGGIAQLVRGVVRSVAAFFQGTMVARRKRLTLAGYLAVQDASYFALPLAPGLTLFAADRQLRKVDFRQRAFFRKAKQVADASGDAFVFVAPDPAIAYGEAHEPGAKALEACGLSLDDNRVLYLTGDLHHYERRKRGHSMHVVAGGGGAFTHGTRIGPSPSGAAECSFPDAAASRSLAMQVPLKLTVGRAGFLVHLAAGLLASIEFGAALETHHRILVEGAFGGGAAAFALYFIAGHHRAHAKPVAALALLFGYGIGLSPGAVRIALPRVLHDGASGAATIIVAAFVSALLFGIFLTVLAVTGLEHQQAFAVLGHPGYKHFVRLCVHPSGLVEAFVIGKEDTLGKDPPSLIDSFVFDPTRGAPSGAHPAARDREDDDEPRSPGAAVSLSAVTVPRE